MDQHCSNKRVGVSPKVLLLSDGSNNVWDCMNSLLEIRNKERSMSSGEEKTYMRKIRYPKNPIVNPKEENIYRSKETGSQLTLTFWWYSNRG